MEKSVKKRIVEIIEFLKGEIHFLLIQSENRNVNFFTYMLNRWESKFGTIKGEAVKLAHPSESASLKKKYTTKKYLKVFIE